MTNMPNPEATSISHLMDLDESGQISSDSVSFDDQLWFMLFPRIDTPEQAQTFAEPVWVYFASRTLEWEVGNGGFPQAAYNIPEWFPLAAKAYCILGLETAEALIDEAFQLVLSGERRDESFDADTIGDLFSQFSESKLAELDSRLNEVGWWANEQRLALVRQNRDVFRAISQ